MKILKQISLLTILLITGISFAQNSNYDVVKTTTIKPLDTKESITEADNNIIIITEMKQEVVMNPDQKYQLNQDRILTPTSITKTIMLGDNDNSIYDVQGKISYKKHEGDAYALKSLTDDLSIDKIKGDNKLYMLEADEISMLGYFDTSKDFVILSTDFESDSAVSNK